MRMKTTDFEPNALMEQIVEHLEMATVVRNAYHEGMEDETKRQRKKAESDAEGNKRLEKLKAGQR